jgi:hypothetical protein
MNFFTFISHLVSLQFTQPLFSWGLQVELIKDYDCIIEYHPGKANVVADALNLKSKAVMDEPTIWDGMRKP